MTIGDLRAGLPFAGLAIWAVRFVAVYAVAALACERGWDPAIVRATVLGTAAIGLALNAVLIVAGMRLLRQVNGGSAPFLGAVAAAVAALSSLAIVLETVPTLLILPACGLSL